MKFFNKDIPDGIYSHHEVVNGETVKEYTEEVAIRLIPLLSRCYALIPAPITEGVKAALEHYGIKYTVPTDPEDDHLPPMPEGEEPKGNKKK